MFYIFIVLFFVRIIFWVVEYWFIVEYDYWKLGFDFKSLSLVIRYESFFYVFEVMLMLINYVLLNVRYLRMWLLKSIKMYLFRVDGVMEIDGLGYKDGRLFWVMFVDFFDVYGLLGGRKKGGDFWDGDGE